MAIQYVSDGGNVHFMWYIYGVCQVEPSPGPNWCFDNGMDWFINCGRPR